MEMKVPKWKYTVSGIVAGIVNGFFGGGGGLALVPMLSGLCHLDARSSLATSVAVILPLCVSSSIVYFLRTGLTISSAVPYLIGGLIGGIIGGLVMRRIPTNMLRRSFALLAIYGGLRALL